MVRALIEIIKENARCFKQTATLASLNNRKKYKGSDIGWLWSFVKPAMYICVFYLAISVGFKHAKDIDGLICPYFVWLTVGMMCFFYMRGMILGGAACYKKNRTLIVNANYPVSAVPFMNALSELVVHGFIMLGVFIFVLFFGVCASFTAAFSAILASGMASSGIDSKCIREYTLSPAPVPLLALLYIKRADIPMTITNRNVTKKAVT